MFNPQPKPDPRPKKDRMTAYEFRQKYGNKKTTQPIEKKEKRAKKRIKQSSNRAYSNAKRKAKYWLQRFVRVRDADKNGWCKCITCGNTFMWNDAAGRTQGCHYVPAHKNIKTALMEENVHAGCSHCNLAKHQDPAVLRYFAQQIDAKFGTGTAARIEDLSNIPAKYSALELEAIAAHYKAKCNELIKERGFNQKKSE